MELSTVEQIYFILILPLILIKETTVGENNIGVLKMRNNL